MRKIFSILILSLCTLISCTDSSSAQKAKASETTAGKTGGKLYLRTFYWISNNTMEISWIFLGNNGTIVKNPKHGNNPIDITNEKKDNGNYAGSYKTVADKLSITWSNGSKEEWLAQTKNGSYTALNKGPVTLVQPLPSSFRFSGSFSASTFIEGENPVHTFQFDNNGTFQFKKFSDYPSSLQNDAGGTYSVDKNTLVLKFKDGKTAYANIGTLNGSDNKTKRLIINTTYQDL